MEEAGEATIAVEEEGEEASLEKDEEVRMLESERSQRRKISWIWGSTWISGLRSNLLVVVKVSTESFGHGFSLALKRNKGIQLTVSI